MGSRTDNTMLPKPPQKNAPRYREPVECILHMGLQNNMVAWGEKMMTTTGILYGITAVFFCTNKRHVIPWPLEEDYVPQFPMAAQGKPQESLPVELISHLRMKSYVGRMKAVSQQKNDECRIWCMMWAKMSTSSRCIVKQEEGFKEAYLKMDCVKLWELIRITHEPTARIC